MAMAVTVPVTNGTVEMDGHRPSEDIYSAMSGPRPIAQLRVTQPGHYDHDNEKVVDESIIELALTRGQIRDLIDMLELYR